MMKWNELISIHAVITAMGSIVTSFVRESGIDEYRKEILCVRYICIQREAKPRLQG